MDRGSSTDDEILVLSPPVLSSKSRSLRKPQLKETKPQDKTHVKKSGCEWISSSFSGFTNLSGVKRKQRSDQPVRTGKTKGSSVQDDAMWADKHQPQNEVDLVVHKKKIADVRNWLLENLCSQSGRVLLLRGPVGTGKTATIKVLANELQVELQEWMNPTLRDFEQGNFDPSSGLRYQSQESLFSDFLLRANKYPCLNLLGGKQHASEQKLPPKQGKIVLVEEFPNTFYRDPRKFHDILLKYRKNGRCPLVFIVSDTEKRYSSLQKLFPKDLQVSAGISTISFNPVATTSLLRALNRIVSKESKKPPPRFTSPDKDALDSLVAGCNGDIRAAVNSLQFLCLKGIKGMSKREACKKPKLVNAGNLKSSSTVLFQRSASSTALPSHDENLTSIGGKDVSMFLFRALGKILYCKRDPSQAVPGHLQLPKHLSQHHRDPPLFNPEEIVEQSQLSAEFFCLYLHQNFVDFFSDINDLVSASEYLSDADVISANWANRAQLSEYSSCVTSRGIMFSNKVRTNTKTGAVAGGWRPLHKPQWLSTFKQRAENLQSARELFRMFHHGSHVDLETDILPYLCLTKTQLQSPGHMSFLRSICLFPKSKTPLRYDMETLDERDAGPLMDDDEDAMLEELVKDKESTLGSEEQVAQMQEEEGEEEIIEEFDDD